MSMPQRKATFRFGQRELSFISLGVILVVLGSLIFGVYHLFLGFRSQRDIVVGDSNLNSIYKGIKRYAEDWDGKLPKSVHWSDDISGYLPAMRMPAGHGDEGPVGYVYNSLAAEYNLDRPDKEKVSPRNLVLVIERTGAPLNTTVAIPPVGAPGADEALVKAVSFSHFADDTENATTLVLYADGTTQRLKRRDFTQK